MPVLNTEEITEEELALYEMPPERRVVNYVDNDKLTEVMIVWAAANDAANKAGRERPRMPEYIGACIHLIATNTARKGNYSGYSWVDEMIDDGVEACCSYLHNWRADAVTRGGKPNPFGYISRIVDQAFKHRIEVEKRQDYYKNKSLLLMGGPEVLEGEEWGDAQQTETANNMLRDMVNRAYEYEEKQAARAAIEKEKTIANKKATTPTLMDMFAEIEESSDGEA